MTKHRYERKGFVPEPEKMSTANIEAALAYTRKQLVNAEWVRSHYAQPIDMERHQDARIRGMRTRIAALEYEYNVRLARASGAA
jgi:hypothetical protein